MRIHARCARKAALGNVMDKPQFKANIIKTFTNWNLSPRYILFTCNEELSFLLFKTANTQTDILNILNNRIRILGFILHYAI